MPRTRPCTLSVMVQVVGYIEKKNSTTCLMTFDVPERVIVTPKTSSVLQP